ncbi:hypothetical protein FHG87_018908 [Trinorchestia longiramus]|nr:hypothetical protein FHG87_018908 [Trinorchestia longiramus]
MFAKVRTSHLQHKEDSMLASVKGGCPTDAALGGHLKEERPRAAVRKHGSGTGSSAAKLMAFLKNRHRLRKQRSRQRIRMSSMFLKVFRTAPPGGVEEMQGGGRRVRLEWRAYITV